MWSVVLRTLDEIRLSTDIDMRLHAKQVCVGRTGEYFRSLHTRLSSRLFQQKENNKKPHIAILNSKSMWRGMKWHVYTVYTITMATTNHS